MIQSDADIDFMLKDAGENTLAVLGTASAYGIFRRNAPVQVSTNGQSVTEFMTTMLIRRGTLAGLAIDETIVINSESFLVRDFVPDAQSSEKLTRIYLAEAPE